MAAARFVLRGRASTSFRSAVPNLRHRRRRCMLNMRLTMRFLIISWHFPPVASIAALRLGKFAQFLHEAGHEVRVITAAKDDVDRSLSVGIPESLIVSCPWFDIDR